MNLILTRYSPSSDSTLGLCHIDGQFACYILEDASRVVKVAGETRIPAGRYQLALRREGGMNKHYGERFPGWHRGMIELQNVPGFTYIYLHIGNTDDDTAGCLLVGDVVNNNQVGNAFLGQSTRAYKRIYPGIADAIEAGEVWIDVRDAA